MFTAFCAALAVACAALDYREFPLFHQRPNGIFRETEYFGSFLDS